MVFFTLITVQGDNGGAISRKALGGGAKWKSTGASKIWSEFVLDKLYFKRDGETTRGSREQGFTAFEFHLPMNHSPRPRVAICVLHPTDYHHTVRDLKDYTHKGCFPGRYQANLQVVQHVRPINQGPCVAGTGFMNSPQVDYTSNLLASNSGRDILGANQVDQMAVHHEGQYLDSHAGFMNGLHVDYTINNTESSGYNPPAGIQMDIPSNTYPMSDDMSYMPSEINMFGGQYSHANAMPIQRDYCDTSFWNSNMHAPIQDAMTSYSQPSIHSAASLEEPFHQLLLSEYNSMPEPGGQNSHADGMSTQNYHYYNPY
ncbi:hypothetical protein TRIUR3_08227 [Triticum urartu]|uniref:Uncharacterized protein n=2 Tax=Triticum urartu TaxID=4572 RepID=M7ZZ85_TRIUA|nr:hypothetical protein TRIUR3_08227 [Triticum urartu]